MLPIMVCQLVDIYHIIFVQFLTMKSIIIQVQMSDDNQLTIIVQIRTYYQQLVDRCQIYVHKVHFHRHHPIDQHVVHVNDGKRLKNHLNRVNIFEAVRFCQLKYLNITNFISDMTSIFMTPARSNQLTPVSGHQSSHNNDGRNCYL